ncbi:hypothetical protein D3C78_1861060 [compost metagenome]
MSLAALAAMAMGDGFYRGVDAVADGAAQAAAVKIGGHPEILGGQICQGSYTGLSA